MTFKTIMALIGSDGAQADLRISTAFPFRIERLAPHDVARAFAVMRIVLPNLDLEAWRALLSAKEQRDQWVAMKDVKGYIRALARILPVKHPLLGHVLDVPLFATTALVGEVAAGHHFQVFAERLAAEESCDAVRLWKSAPSMLHLTVSSAEPNGGEDCMIVHAGGRTLH